MISVDDTAPDKVGTPRCAVIAADPLVQSALERALEDESGVVLEPDPREADVLLVDGGTEPDEALTDAPDHPTIVVLVSEGATAAPLLARGAHGVIRRDVEGDVLVAAVRAVHVGLTVVDSVFRPAETLPRPAAEPLTPREREVLQLIADGLSNRKIAKKLEISEHTAKFHVNAILTKLDADTRTEAVVTAARLGWLLL